MAKYILLITVPLIIACAPVVRQQQPWATMSEAQAEAECLNEVQANPLMSFPRCMKAKGWKRL